MSRVQSVNFHLMNIVKSILRRFLGKNSGLSADEEDLRVLDTLPALPCNAERLRDASTIDLPGILHDKALHRRWSDSTQDPVLAGIPDTSRAINPGDRRAIHYLIDHLRPKSVLEVGTHIGASTAWMSRLLRSHQEEDGIPFELTSVDVKDVNSETDRYWSKFGANHSPRQLMELLGVGGSVRFIAQDSLAYLEQCKQNFDFVFLDGNHRGPHVYREIPLLLELLSPDGVILMHDYCPGGRKLWQQEPAITGPYVAVKRHREEGKPLVAVPLGALPWETKYGSSMTSLALLLRQG